jgi:carboxyl-terminal processing protease
VADPSEIGREILDLLETHFVDRQKLRDWIDAGRGAMLLQAAASKDDKSVDELLRALGVSHTRRFTPRQIEYYHLLDTYAAALGPGSRSSFPRGVVSYPGIGVMAAEIEGRFFVSAVVPGAPAHRAGLLRGDELISLDGLPYQPVQPFAGHEGRRILVGFRREARGPELHASVVPERLRVRALLAQASRSSARTIARNSKVIAYYKPWSLAGERHWQLLVKALSVGLRSCDALVLDLRGGIGGASPDYAEFFVGRAPELALRAPQQAERIVNPRWRKPTVVLVDETTRSGNEVLAFALQRAGIPVVGARTPGEVAAARPFILSDRSLLLIAAYAVAVDGVVLEGVGVSPDVSIPHGVPYAAGSDPQFDAALDVAAGCGGQREPWRPNLDSSRSSAILGGQS